MQFILIYYQRSLHSSCLHSNSARRLWAYFPRYRLAHQFVSMHRRLASARTPSQSNSGTETEAEAEEPDEVYGK
jgi:hypothetical protein